MNYGKKGELGVYAKQSFQRGDELLEYAGEVITMKQLREREERVTTVAEAEKRSYSFTFRDEREKYAHFHSCLYNAF